MKKSRTPPWRKKRPKGKRIKLSAEEKAAAKQRAEKAGRRYPNLVDNMAIARKKKRAS